MFIVYVFPSDETGSVFSLSTVITPFMFAFELFFLILSPTFGVPVRSIFLIPLSFSANTDFEKIIKDSVSMSPKINVWCFMVSVYHNSLRLSICYNTDHETRHCCAHRAPQCG